MKTARSVIFDLSAGDVLAVRREVAEILPSLIGRSYADIRAEIPIEARAETREDLQTYDGTAIINITGPIARYDNICTAMFGGTSVDGLRAQLRRAIAMTSVRGILLYVDSPGGTIDGVADMAEEIYAARGSKPIAAYIDALGASAAYWLGSAASHITVSKTALIGSIGTMAIYRDRTEADEREGVKTIKIVSNQSPYKNTMPTTDEGMRRIQELIDKMNAFFVDAVAKHRNTSVDSVIQHYGQGDVLIAADALAAGMVDAVGTLDIAMQRLHTSYPRTGIHAESTPVTTQERRARYLRTL
jgi:capsid assembly protease